MPTVQGSYVQKFLDSANDLPGAMKRNLALIRELDEKVHALKEEVQAQCSAQLAAAQSGGGLPPVRGGDLIQAQVKQILQLEDEKVALAAQIYGQVDNQIKDLDGDLTTLKSELQFEKDAAAARGEPTTADDKKHAKGGPEMLPDNQLVAPDGAGVMFDTNEPLYCYCQRVSFGEMIGCDNEDCPIEWFHYPCVGVSPDNVPETWYCKECQILKDQGKLES